jgi:transcriptional regulator with XRE-family HTH domain
MRLDEWMMAWGVGDVEFAAMLGLHRASVSRLRRGKREPSVALMREVAKLTDGAVTGNDWVGSGVRLSAQTKD